ncbi:MAG: tryptophan--tRNA ligase [Clostridiales bacterium GWB2_37_7]|nr:MAG: tryptophan--tRNA ligase [Clostridiales bacterium GWB2_37_7]
MNRRKRILTGDRPTGKLHLGHYVGSLQNRVALQNDFDTFIIIADIQALTTNFDRPEKLKGDVLNVAMDNLSVGVDPEKATFFIQSLIPEIAELTTFYSMFVTVNSLRHNPTIKSEIQQYGYNDIMYGFLGYPVSQAADITFCKADLVPVGDDQLSHIELTRRIVRRFNELYKPVLVEPEAMVSKISRLVGLDGNSKMGKSLNNGIYLSDDAATVKQKIRAAVTDASRIKLSDKGNPEICTVFKYHNAFNEGEVNHISESCRSASIGCSACKNNLTARINNILEPIRERRAFYEDRPEQVLEMLISGTNKVRGVAKEVMKEVREAMSIGYFDNSGCC